jgi:uncharacterized protein (DUF58 family)
MRHLFGVILVLLLIASLFRFDFFFYVLYCFFGAYFLSRLWLDHALRKLSGAREYANRAFPGEHVPVRLHVHNRGLLPVPWLHVRESLPVQLKVSNAVHAVFSLLPKEHASVDYVLDCHRRGYYSLGPLELRAGDLFGIQERAVTLTSQDYMIVYPRIVTLTHLGLPAQTPFGSVASRQRFFEDPSRMTGVRDYQSGDSLRHVHWKSTATRGSLQTKRFEPAISVEAQVFLNLHRDEYPVARRVTATELAITTAASIAHYLVEKRQTVGLCCNGLDPFAPEGKIALPPRKGREQLTHLLDVLARVQLGQTHAFGSLLQDAHLHLTWGGTAIVITGDATDELFVRLLQLVRSGYHVLLILTDSQAPVAGVRARAKEVGIDVYEVWEERDLDVWRE